MVFKLKDSHQNHLEDLLHTNSKGLELPKNLCKKQVASDTQAAVPGWYCVSPRPKVATGENLFKLLQLQQNSGEGQRPIGKETVLFQEITLANYRQNFFSLHYY